MTCFIVFPHCLLKDGSKIITVRNCVTFSIEIVNIGATVNKSITDSLLSCDAILADLCILKRETFGFIVSIESLFNKAASIKILGSKPGVIFGSCAFFLHSACVSDQDSSKIDMDRLHLLIVVQNL